MCKALGFDPQDLKIRKKEEGEKEKRKKYRKIKLQYLRY
jgi:hypothetical protein